MGAWNHYEPRTFHLNFLALKMHKMQSKASTGTKIGTSMKSTPTVELEF
jgi:hypothetical protein